MVADKCGQVLDQLHALGVIPPGELPALRFEFVRMKDAETVASLEVT